MTKIRIEKLYWQGQWYNHPTVTLDSKGVITSFDKKSSSVVDEEWLGYMIPGICNAHSHSFQYAMAGLAEKSIPGKSNDNFWAWRDSMYRLANALDPESVTAIGRAVFSAMLEAGYTSVVEFHYVHHQADGNSYQRKHELGLCLAEAATDVGIDLILVPVYYNQGGLGKPVSQSQRRFYFDSVESYHDLLDQLNRDLPQGVSLGQGVHSVRAALPEDILSILTGAPHCQGPRHLHIAEQMVEVNEFQSLVGKRPVEWLLEHTSNEKLSLVHATHLTREETRELALSSHCVVICPTTEANLGDGIFPLDSFISSEGQWAIGSDSHIQVSPFRELESVDYHLRLTKELRNPLLFDQHQNSGKLLFDRALEGSEIAGSIQGQFEIGQRFNGIVLDASHPVLVGKPDDDLLSAIIFGHDSRMIKRVVMNGQVLVESGMHKKQDSIRQQYRETMARIQTHFT
ncbi:formimidoylglutamate deiminase [Pseudobacteriovorax antillogorgiicola]|uniref:Formimidoylglutamate deiminase n=1 Tax=Pseudobacteriovorax antillogorgiicola TaxID=1513793 RepID=A0A1Y6CC32_9BACT|nr:formimidoylglutamate deiminase [Pseudobacteriovorax antillogorgiicola]TCS49408.1 formimidoylglutamate deiminase [Pseudobacteriovorax antillogorgiicola]SMF46988.1 formimidoylglutamate deiminase [Pseudobacteriovorax antillogorgiicola]